MGTGRRLSIDKDALARIRDHATDDYPREACGLLVGRFEPGGFRVTGIHPAANIARGLDVYEVDPADFLRAQAAADGRGEEVVGAYHSHPDRPARPSRLDCQRSWPAYVYVIVAVGRGRTGEVTAWMSPGEGAPLGAVSLEGVSLAKGDGEPGARPSRVRHRPWARRGASPSSPERPSARRRGRPGG